MFTNNNKKNKYEKETKEAYDQILNIVSDAAGIERNVCVGIKSWKSTLGPPKQAPAATVIGQRCSYVEVKKKNVKQKAWMVKAKRSNERTNERMNERTRNFQLWSHTIR